jgi:NosR/NirI family nitrite reductase transcriptional regulator
MQSSGNPAAGAAMIRPFFHLIACLILSVSAALAEPGPDPAPSLVAQMLGLAPPVQLRRVDGGVPGWTVLHDHKVVAHLGSSWDIAGTLGYSGRPLDVLVALSPQGRILAARLVRHEEPVLTLGISDADIAAHVAGFSGIDPAQDRPEGMPDVISRATVTTGVIRDGILRAARILAVARGILPGAGVDRVSHMQADWLDLLELGALAETRVSMAEAAAALAGAKVPVTPSDGAFVHLWSGIADTPTVGANLFGAQDYGRIMGALAPGDSVLVVMSAGLQSHRGTDWQQTGIFDRLTLRQGEATWQPEAARYRMIRKLRIDGAPELKEISVFALPPQINPTRPFTLDLRATRPAAQGGAVALTISLPFTLPAAFRQDPPQPEPLWMQIWRAKLPQAAVVVAMLVVLTGILFAQESITRRPRLWRRLRLGFLATSFLVLGMGLNGQLSVVQVVAFLNALLSGFRWETFLVEPVIFLLWGFTALGLLFWGRGVYCGWLCPFGALQELANAAAQRLGVRQIAVPQALHERLWVIKYTLFVAIVALSFYSMHYALILAEAEPFKTAISMRFLRAWPFVLVVLAILTASLFIERFYCRYLCPLGAGLAIPAKLKIFDWLHRRPQCGRECRLCETKCTVGAIDAIGRINPNECVLCLRCQVIMNDAATCPVLKRRARAPEATP